MRPRTRWKIPCRTQCSPARIPAASSTALGSPQGWAARPCVLHGRVDICTVFGSLPGNAIEHELTVPNRELGLIYLEVSIRRRFLLVRCENHFKGELTNHFDKTDRTAGKSQYTFYEK